MANYHIAHPDPALLVKHLQYETLLTLVPPKRTLFDNRPSLVPEKYQSHFHKDGFFQNTNTLLNALNNVRGWHHNGSPLQKHVSKCVNEFQDIISLVQEQFVALPLPLNDPYAFVIKTACQSLLKSLTWTQLRDEIKSPPLNSFNDLVTLIFEKFDEMQLRPKCHLCGFRIINLTRHLKSHANSQSQQEKAQAYLEFKLGQSRQFFSALVEINHEFGTCEQLYQARNHALNILFPNEDSCSD